MGSIFLLVVVVVLLVAFGPVMLRERSAAEFGLRVAAEMLSPEPDFSDTETWGHTLIYNEISGFQQVLDAARTNSEEVLVSVGTAQLPQDAREFSAAQGDPLPEQLTMVLVRIRVPSEKYTSATLLSVEHDQGVCRSIFTLELSAFFPELQELDWNWRIRDRPM
ncbi:MAG: hypothetical protein AAGF84_10990 [Planctomycetota bacterium]